MDYKSRRRALGGAAASGPPPGLAPIRRPVQGTGENSEAGDSNAPVAPEPAPQEHLIQGCDEIKGPSDKFDHPSQIIEFFKNEGNLYKFIYGIGSLLEYKESEMKKNIVSIEREILKLNEEYAKNEKNYQTMIEESQKDSSSEMKDSLQGSVREQLNKSYETKFSEKLIKKQAYDVVLKGLENRRWYIVKQLQSENPGKEIVDRIISVAKGIYKLYRGPKYVDIRTNLFRQIKTIAANPALFRNSFFLNSSIVGPAGSGKTLMAREIAKWYAVLGILTYDSFYEDDRFKLSLDEVSRAGLIGEYMGQTAPKTLGVLAKSLEKTLFVDEAYSVTGCSFDAEGKVQADSYGEEFLATLLLFMNDHKGYSAIIVAGYENQMRKCFFDRNEGLPRRFPNQIILPFYSTDELFGIFIKNVIEKVSIPLLDKMADSDKMLKKRVRDHENLAKDTKKPRKALSDLRKAAATATDNLTALSSELISKNAAKEENRLGLLQKEGEIQEIQTTLHINRMEKEQKARECALKTSELSSLEGLISAQERQIIAYRDTIIQLTSDISGAIQARSVAFGREDTEESTIIKLALLRYANNVTERQNRAREGLTERIELISRLPPVMAVKATRHVKEDESVGPIAPKARKRGGSAPDPSPEPPINFNDFMILLNKVSRANLELTEQPPTQKTQEAEEQSSIIGTRIEAFLEDYNELISLINSLRDSFPDQDHLEARLNEQYVIEAERKLFIAVEEKTRIVGSLQKETKALEGILSTRKSSLEAVISSKEECGRDLVSLIERLEIMSAQLKELTTAEELLNLEKNAISAIITGLTSQIDAAETAKTAADAEYSAMDSSIREITAKIAESQTNLNTAEKDYAIDKYYYDFSYFNKLRYITTLKPSFLLIHNDTTFSSINLLRRYLISIQTRIALLATGDHYETNLSSLNMGIVDTTDTTNKISLGNVYSYNILAQVLINLFDTDSNSIRKPLFRRMFYKHVFNFQSNNLSYFPAQAGEMENLADLCIMNLGQKLKERDAANVTVGLCEEADVINTFLLKHKVKIEYYKKGNFVDREDCEAYFIELIMLNSETLVNQKRIFEFLELNKLYEAGIPSLKDLYLSLLDETQVTRLTTHIINVYLKHVSEEYLLSLKDLTDNEFPIHLSRKNLEKEIEELREVNKYKVHDTIFNKEIKSSEMAELKEYKKYYEDMADDTDFTKLVKDSAEQKKKVITKLIELNKAVVADHKDEKNLINPGLKSLVEPGTDIKIRIGDVLYEDFASTADIYEGSLCESISVNIERKGVSNTPKAKKNAVLNSTKFVKRFSTESNFAIDFLLDIEPRLIPYDRITPDSTKPYEEICAGLGTVSSVGLSSKYSAMTIPDSSCVVNFKADETSVIVDRTAYLAKLTDKIEGLRQKHAAEGLDPDEALRLKQIDALKGSADNIKVKAVNNALFKPGNGANNASPARPRWEGPSNTPTALRPSARQQSALPSDPKTGVNGALTTFRRRTPLRSRVLNKQPPDQEAKEVTQLPGQLEVTNIN